MWVIWLQHTGAGVAFDSPTNTIWALANGPATVLPLALFAWSARRLPLSTIGFIQFLAPTIVFVIGVTQGEALGWLRIVSFVFIWGGAAVFAWGAFRKVRAGADTAETICAPEPGLLDDPAEDRMHELGRSSQREL